VPGMLPVLDTLLVVMNDTASRESTVTIDASERPSRVGDGRRSPRLRRDSRMDSPERRDCDCG
jgi:hypothetical protein